MDTNISTNLHNSCVEIMKVISIDLDGTLANTVKPVLRKIAENEGVKLKMRQIVRYNISKISGVSQTRIAEMWHDVWREPEKVPLVDKRIPSIINSLKQDFKIKILTGSIVDTPNIKKWLEVNNIYYDIFEQLQDWHNKPFSAGEIHIDDHFSVSKAFAQNKKRMILLEQHWNSGRNSVWNESEFIRVAKNWRHVERMLAKEI